MKVNLYFSSPPFKIFLIVKYNTITENHINSQLSSLFKVDSLAITVSRSRFKSRSRILSPWKPVLGSLPLPLLIPSLLLKVTVSFYVDHFLAFLPSCVAQVIPTTFKRTGCLKVIILSV